MNTTPKLLSREEVTRIARRVLSFVTDPGEGTAVTIRGWWNGELRWARNRVSLASDRRDVIVSVERFMDGWAGTAETNQIDDVSLESAVRSAERGTTLANIKTVSQIALDPPRLVTPAQRIWSDATVNVTADQRGGLARTLTESAEAKTFLSAGYIEMRASEVGQLDTRSIEPDQVTYTVFTQAQCSMTVRHPKGIGSGWAGLSSYDWSAIDSPLLARRALEKCEASVNPVAIEPGRYTVVLEPQAVSDLFEPLFGWLNTRVLAEQGNGPFPLEYDGQLRLWRTKLGLKVMDERITIHHDLNHPSLGVLPHPGLESVTWIRNGVLETLAYGRGYALGLLNENLGKDNRPAYYMSGGDTDMAEMIATTKRGLLVTRFSNLMELDRNSVLYTGVTRDGLWLIENGKISKAVKNLRFTESPVFMLNQVDQLGHPVPVFRPVDNPYTPGVSPAFVPPIKAHDFSFTSAVDAV